MLLLVGKAANERRAVTDFCKRIVTCNDWTKRITHQLLEALQRDAIIIMALVAVQTSPFPGMQLTLSAARGSLKT